MKIIFLIIVVNLSSCILFDSKSFLENKKQTATEHEKKMIDESISQLPQKTSVVLNPLEGKRSDEIKQATVLSHLKYVIVAFDCENMPANDSLKYFVNKEVKWVASSKTDNFKGSIFVDERGVIQLPLDVYRTWTLSLSVEGINEIISINTSGIENKAQIYCH